MNHFLAKEVTAILRKHGFALVSQKGSHQKWRNPETRKQLIVAYHKGKQLPEGTLKNIIKGSGVPQEDWK
jgi:predicted RNA binding protein YcfA (HicA-like mRNA interferase family)